MAISFYKENVDGFASIESVYHPIRHGLLAHYVNAEKFDWEIRESEPGQIASVLAEQELEYQDYLTNPKVLESVSMGILDFGKTD